MIMRLQNLLKCAALSAALVTPLQSEAAPTCMPLEAAQAALLTKFGEVEIWRGLGAGGQVVIEVYQNEDGGWTILQVDANKTACILATGSHGIVTPLQREDEGDPS